MQREREIPRSIGVGDIIGGVWSNILIVVVDVWRRIKVQDLRSRERHKSL
jgi:hypothetical protein